MKNRIKQVHAFCIIAIFLLCNSSLYAQQYHHVRDDVSHAVGVLRGIYYDYSPQRAFDIIKEVAETDSDAYAMNVLGLLYMEGLGIEKDGKQAVYWLDRAGKNGFCDAYHNLGIIYKLGKCGEKQNFTSAYEYFLKGALNGSNNCRYDVGFMLYKGLGCKQDYAKAIEFFQTASGNGNIYATYMLGLSHRNGYGTEKNEEKGMELLNKAATLGYSAAIEEVMRENPENYLTDTFTSDTLFALIPDKMPEIRTDVNDTTFLKGCYSGFVVMYDWSGQHVLGEKPVVMNVNRIGQEVSGLIVFGTDSVKFTADITADGTLKFRKSFLSLNERYAFNGKVKYMLSNAVLDIWNEKILGKLSLYSLTQREPERPMYMELYRSGMMNEIPQNDCGHISITPNPFDSNFDVIFELTDNATASAKIFDKFGMLVWQDSLGALETGKHKITVCPNIKQGYYVLNITAGKQVLRTIIVKKGGE